jgi:prepilin-type N-terminal cleavage/methylation domain-containing protein
MHTTRGFTLIELLVVIAIIGILSSIVLSSLNTARNKGMDAGAKSTLSDARAQAQLFYGENNNKFVQLIASATDVCHPLANNGASTNGVKGINALLYSAAQSEGITTVLGDTTGGPGKAVCNSTPNGWAIELPLKDGTYYCVDWNGNATSTTNSAILSNGLDTDC